MTTNFEDMIVLQRAERLTDEVWHYVVRWDTFAKDVVGKQLARAADSIGANIAEAFGRFNYGEKIQFLYYARGSLYETKYWLNRALARDLMPRQAVDGYATKLTDVSRLINTYVKGLKEARTTTSPTRYKTVREEAAPYLPELTDDEDTIVTRRDMAWFTTFPTDPDLVYPPDDFLPNP